MIKARKDQYQLELKEYQHKLRIYEEQKRLFAAYSKAPYLINTIKKHIHPSQRHETGVEVHVPWTIIPPGHWTFDRLFQHYSVLMKRHPEVEWQPERLRFVQTLRPSSYVVGRDDFEGYCVFLFDWTHRALLEHPIKGNAVYIFQEFELSLTRLTKAQMRARQRTVERVIHIGDWQTRIWHVLRSR
jgi:hypothetical protein